MLLDIFKFELNYHRHQYLVYVLSGVFFLLIFLATTTPNIQIGGAGLASVNINSPYTILVTLDLAASLAMFAGIAFVGNSVIRDFDCKSAELFFSKPIPKHAYIYGRFFGSLCFAYVTYIAGMLGILLGEWMPWLDPERLGDFNFGAYLYASTVFALPNLFVMCSVFFCVAAVTRSMMATYASAIGLIMVIFLLDTFTERDLIMLTSVLDPMGSTALEEVTRYWTPFERNSQLPAIEGALLLNRAVWFVIGCGALVLTYFLFPFSLEKGQKKAKKSATDDAPIETRAIAYRAVMPVFNNQTLWMQYLSQAKLEVKNVLKSNPFRIIAALGLFQVVAASFGNLGNISGTSLYPSTSILVNTINGSFSLALLIVLIYYSGELMVRERAVKVSEILDAMPYPNWVMIAAKVTGIVTVVMGLLLATVVAAIGVQLYKQYFDINLPHYLLGLLFFFQFPLYLMIVMSIFFYVLTRSKYIAMFLMIVYFVVTLALPQLGFEHYLYSFRTLRAPYSDFTGYSQNLVPYLWQTFYWGLAGCLMLLVIHLLWPRGAEDDWKNRVRVMRQRMTAPVVVALWGFTTAFVLTGGWIFYNTNILNEYETGRGLEKKQAEYEKRFKQYEFQPLPEITNVYAEVDIYPSEQEARLRGYYDMENKTGEPLTELHFSRPLGTGFGELQVPNSTLTMEDDIGYRIYTFDEPLAPGESIRVEFQMDWLTPGFANNAHSPKLAKNGTFFNNTDLFPLPGYQRQAEMVDNNRRRRFDLPPVERMAKIDDPDAPFRTPFLGSRVSFETIVSTDEGQIAIAPGYLQKDWVEGDRHFYHYKMDQPIWNFYSFVSADYEVKRDKWKDVDIEVYYKHDYNIDRMIEASKESLAYFSENFSPYQYRQFRIMEFPAFQGRFAQSFPNTIPFSEAIGFTADLRDPTEIDYVYYVTAHELAHQWWAHQVLGADVQGSTMIVETLAQYSALMVMEAEYGSEVMKRFLEFELDRYLSARGSELIEELPLYLVENQPYIHYRKGSVVLYALKDYVGEDVVNASLAEFIDQYAFKGAPYPTTKDLLAIVREKAGPEFEPVIADLFEKIILFDLKVESAEVAELDDGQYEITVDVAAAKFEADGEGQEVSVPMQAWVDIGVLGEKQGDAEVPEVLYLQKVEITEPTQTVTVRVDKPPVSVGIDPMNKLIDRNPEDNIKDV